jgi:two-component system response regulator HydG
VADDHDSLRRGLVRALSDAHHEVDEAPNGTVAIERLQDSQFDVVLTDLRMGGADGMDVLRTTRSIQPSAAVILMTAFGSIHTAVEAMKIGAFDFVMRVGQRADEPAPQRIVIICHQNPAHWSALSTNRQKQTHPNQ